LFRDDWGNADGFDVYGCEVGFCDFGGALDGGKLSELKKLIVHSTKTI